MYFFTGFWIIKVGQARITSIFIQPKPRDKIDCGEVSEHPHLSLLPELSLRYKPDKSILLSLGLYSSIQSSYSPWDLRRNWYSELIASLMSRPPLITFVIYRRLIKTHIPLSEATLPRYLNFQHRCNIEVRTKPYNEYHCHIDLIGCTVIRNTIVLHFNSDKWIRRLKR